MKKCQQHGTACFQDWDLLHDKLKENDGSCGNLILGIESMVNPDVFVAVFMNLLMWKGSGELALDTNFAEQSLFCFFFFFLMLTIESSGKPRLFKKISVTFNCSVCGGLRGRKLELVGNICFAVDVNQSLH